MADVLHIELVNVLITVVGVCAGLVTRYGIAYLKKKGILTQLENKKEIVKIVVMAIEQSFKVLEGKEKLEYAKVEVAKLLQQKKIKISEKELDLLIEATVKEVKDTAKKELKK